MGQVELNINDIYSKLSLIEQHLGFKTMSRYSPSHMVFGSVNIVDIQKEASQMLKHVGLTQHIPVITFTETEQNEGGNIELDYSNNVFIQISEKYRNSPKQILAVMAHEICHKVLYVHGLFYKDKFMRMENEILADLATVYVGFGDLSLAGCYMEYKTKYYNRTETIGYITYLSFAQAQKIFRDSVNISVKDLKETLKASQEVVSTTYKNIVVLENVISQIKDIIRKKYIETHNDLVNPFNYEDENLYQQKILAVKAIDQYQNQNRDYRQLYSINSYLSELVNHITNDNSIGIILDNINKSLKDLECPICGYKKPQALQENKKALIKCNKCNHYFLWDGEMLIEKEVETSTEKDVELNHNTESEPLLNKKKGFFSKFFKSK